MSAFAAKDPRATSNSSKLTVMRVTLAPGQWGNGEQQWNALFRAVPSASPYLCTPWVRAWIDTFSGTLPCEQLVVCDAQGGVRGSCLLTKRTNRRALVPLHRYFLNTSGENDADSVVVEHNAVLCTDDDAPRVYAAVAGYLEQLTADELLFAGGTEKAVAFLLGTLPHWRADIEWRESPVVDLVKLRASGRDYESVLSRNTREQLRRSLRKYRDRGELTLRVASTAAEAQGMLDNLIGLHDARWHERGKPGGFATPARRAFHEAFVKRGVSDGNAQLLQVNVGDEVIGVLYNLVANGQVCFYQSGLRYDADAHLKPGFVVHFMAVEHYLNAGYTTYDFLPSGPGEGRYKASLSTAVNRVGLLLMQRPGWRRHWFDAARAVRNGLSFAKH